MKKLKYIIISLLSVAICFNVFSIAPKAASFDYNVKTLSFTHGSVSISSGLGNQYGTSNIDICNYLSFTFDKYYSGTVTLKWTYSSSAWRQNLTDWNILVIGGKIDSNNNTSGNIVFRVYDTDNFMVIMTYNNDQTLIGGTDPTFSFTSASSSLTAVTDHNDMYSNIDNIDSQLSTANTQLTGIVSLLGALQNLQNTISTNISTLVTEYAQESDGITNTDIENDLNLLQNTVLNVQNLLSGMYDHFTTIENKLEGSNEILGDIEDNTDGIETLLTAIEGTLIVNGVSSIGQIASTQAAILAALTSQSGDNIFDMITDLLDLFNDPTSGLVTQITALGTLLTATNSKLDDINTALGNILTSVNNIDTQIDNISWVKLNINYLGATLDGNTYDLTAGNKSKDYYYEFDTITINNYSTDIIHIRVPLYLNDFNINYINLTNSTITDDSYYELLYYNYGRRYSDLYFMPSNSNIVTRLINGNVKLRIKTNYITYQFNNNNFAYIETLSSNDIEYWQLLSYFNQYNTNKELLDNLLINVDSETSLTIYNTDNQIIDNINNGLGNEYSVFRPIVNQQLAPLNDTNLLNEFSNQRTLFDYLFRNLFNIDPTVEDPQTVTNPIFLILIFGGILLALVG